MMIWPFEISMKFTNKSKKNHMDNISNKSELKKILLSS